MRKHSLARNRSAGLLAAMFLAFGLASCGSGPAALDPAHGAGLKAGAAPGQRQQLHSSPARPVISPITLPAPSALRSASGGTGDRLLDGNENDAALPKARVFNAAPGLSFAPGGAASLGNAAYATYRFDLPSYGGAGAVQTSWDSQPAGGSFYLGVANFASNTWSWFAGDSGTALALPGGLTFLSPTKQVYIVVLLTGSAVHQLNTISFGVDGLPVAVLHPQYQFSDLGNFIKFDGSASTADAGITKYEWDLDGDGSFETDTGLVDHKSKSYPLAGTHNVKLRVTDGLGHSSVDSEDITIDSDGYDEVEPNNTTNTANVLPGMGLEGWEGNVGPGGYDGGNQDYYVYNVTEASRVAFFFTATDFSDQVFMNLSDSTGSNLLASTIGQDKCTLRYVFPAAGSYLLSVGSSGNVSLNYTLRTDVSYGLHYDEVEPNNISGQANFLDAAGVDSLWANVGAGGYDGGTEDWYKVTVAADTFYQFTVLYPTQNAALDLQLTDGVGVLSEADFVGGSDGTTLGYDFTSAGTYYLRCFIDPFSGPSAVTDYQLQVKNLGPAPTVVLQADSVTAPQPYLAQFDASSSTLPPGTAVVQYQWDLNGDGIFDKVTGPGETSTSAKFYRAAFYTPHLRIVLDNGAWGDGTTSLVIEGVTNEVEPNDDSMHASGGGFGFTNYYGDVGLGGYDGSAVDFYSFNESVYVQATITLDYEPSFAPMSLTLFNTDGTTVIASSADEDGHEVIDTSSLMSNSVYFIKVETENSYGGNSGYALSVAPHS